MHTDWGVYRSDLDQLHPDALPPNMDDGEDTELGDKGQGLSESDEGSEEHSSDELSVLDDEENDSDHDYLPEPDMVDEGESDLRTLSWDPSFDRCTKAAGEIWFIYVFFFHLYQYL